MEAVTEPLPKMTKKRVTIDSIARRARVSKATVSRVLNSKPDVDPDTREKVMRIIRKVGYVPSAVASGLAKGRSPLIGLVLPSLTWPWALEILRGIGEGVESTHYDLVLYTLGSPERNDQLFAYTLGAGLAAGVIVIVPPEDISYFEKLHAKGFPAVLIDDRASHPDFPSVTATNRFGAYQATKHLTDLGHQIIAFLNGPSKYGCCRERLEGYRDALQEANIPFSSHLVLESDFTESGGAVAVQPWLESGNPPTAIFAANDLMAFGVLKALALRGFQVPEDIAVVGFDDIPPAANSRPALTTVRQPMFTMGRTAVEMVTEQIHTGALKKARMELETELVIRESSLSRHPMAG